VNDVDNIYAIKSGKPNPKTYAQAVASGTIGFEGLHFFFFRIQKTLILIDILWKIVLASEERSLFRTVLDMVVCQMFEEYVFVRSVLKQLEDEWLQPKQEIWTVDFLYFYEHFIWKNKKMVEMYDKYCWFFKRELIRFPSLYFSDESVSKPITDKLLELRVAVDKLKHYVNNKQSYDTLSSLCAKYFNEMINEGDDNGERDGLLLSRRNILNRLDSGKKVAKVDKDERKYLHTERKDDTAGESGDISMRTA